MDQTPASTADRFDTARRLENSSSPRRRRVARKPHVCDARLSDYCSPISKGDAYLELTELPGQGGLANTAGRPVRTRHCVYCAARHDSDYLLHPMPPAQDYRYWDIDSENMKTR